MVHLPIHSALPTKLVPWQLNPKTLLYQSNGESLMDQNGGKAKHSHVEGQLQTFVLCSSVMLDILWSRAKAQSCSIPGEKFSINTTTCAPLKAPPKAHAPPGCCRGLTISILVCRRAILIEWHPNILPNAQYPLPFIVGCIIGCRRVYLSNVMNALP